MKSYGNVIGRLILAVSLSVVWIVAVLGWVRHFGRTGPQAAAKEPSDSMAIVVDAEVKKWQPIMSDGPSDATKPDHPINVVDDVGVIGEDNWIVRFTVTKGVNGEFDSEGVQMLIHSPSRDGITRGTKIRVVPRASVRTTRGDRLVQAPAGTGTVLFHVRQDPVPTEFRRPAIDVPCGGTLRKRSGQICSH